MSLGIALVERPSRWIDRQPADELVFRLFVGGSTQLVKATNLRAEVPLERVVDAMAYDARPARSEPPP